MLTIPSNPGKFGRILISHLHGDHLSGLPGLPHSCLTAGNVQLLTFYRLKGLRELTGTALCLGGLWTDYPLDIVEIAPGETMDDDLQKVTAYPSVHPLECYGFRIQEHDKPGALDANALKAVGVKAGPWFQGLKAGKTTVLEDGRTIHSVDFLVPATRGKSAAIFSDVGPRASAIELARGVDVMVYETMLDASMEEEANSRGHSSTRQAVQLALDAGVGRLIVTRVSSRYGEKGRQRLPAECKAIFPDMEPAHDFTIFTV